MNNDEYRAYREKMRSIPSKRGDLRLQAEASVEGPGFMLTAVKMALIEEKLFNDIFSKQGKKEEKGE